MAVIESISVFGSLCSIYSTFKSSGKKPQDYSKTITKSIIAMDLLKEAHTNSQKLRELCRSVRTNAINPLETSSNAFNDRINDLMDVATIFNGYYKEFEQEIFVPVKIQFSKELLPFTKELRGVTNSTLQIIQYLKLIHPIVEEYESWYNAWEIDNYKAEENIAFYNKNIFKLENPSRMVLMNSNMAIMNSITLFKSIVTSLLES